MNIEKRLTAIEENAYFQETRLEGLDEALDALAGRLDALEREMGAARKSIAALRAEMEADAPENAAPPHYNQQI